MIDVAGRVQVRGERASGDSASFIQLFGFAQLQRQGPENDEYLLSGMFSCRCVGVETAGNS